MNRGIETLKNEISQCSKCELAKPPDHVILGGGNKITRDPGKWLSWQDRLALPVYHPAALLRDPVLKRDNWGNFKKIFYKYCMVVNQQHYSPHIISKK